MRWLALLAVLAGCASKSKDVSFSWRGAERDIDSAYLAASAWNEACGTRLTVTERADADVVIVADEKLWDAGYAGFTTPGTVRYVSGMPAERTRAVLAHEMGHVLGLGHVADDDDVMNVHADGAVTSADCEEL